MEQQVHAQRLEFERQLAEQRREFEAQSIRQQQTMQEKITQQIVEGFSQRGNPSTNAETSEIATFMANQTRQMQMLTDMFAQVVNGHQSRNPSSHNF